MLERTPEDRRKRRLSLYGVLAAFIVISVVSIPVVEDDCPTKGGTNEEDMSGSLPCLPGVECRAGTGENKRSVEVRQTFRSAQHSRRRQAGSRLCDRTDQLYGYERRHRRKQDEIWRRYRVSLSQGR